MSQPEMFGDRYELVRHIARGGMAQVYLARDMLLGRPVALKVLFPELSVDESFVERFRREAQAAANLSHPNIVAVYDWGQGDNTYFIVMEYVDGATLSSMIRNEVFDAERAAAIGAEVARALDFAHRRGVIHRDVKPGNVLIDESGQVKVTDFGIARAMGTKEGLTQTGAVMGTATYFSPEQAQGHPVDARSDVYSLGVVLYEMVAGQAPFAGENPVSIAYKHVREEPTLPSDLNPAVPADFEAIVMKAMAKDPEDRYQSAEDLRADLVRFGQGQELMIDSPTMAMAVAHPYPKGRNPYDTQRTTAVGAAGYEDPPRRSRSWPVMFLVLLAILGVLVFFIGRQEGWWAAPAKLTVPTDLVGKTATTAKAELISKGFSDVSQHSENSAKPVGQVLASQPAAGSKVPASTHVTLDVSAGPSTVPVPDVSGDQQSQADSAITSAGLTYKNTSQSNDTVSQGYVISTDPPSGTQVEPGKKVTVVVSSGPSQIKMPSLAGTDPTSAVNQLTSLGLQVSSETYEPSATVPTGEVTRTVPPAGSPVAAGTSVVIYLSSGPALTTVPGNLVGLQVGSAESELKSQGIAYLIEYQQVADSKQNGVVLSTNPGPGQQVAQGTAVTLMIGTTNLKASTTSTTTGGGSSSTSDATTTTAPATTSTSS